MDAAVTISNEKDEFMLSNISLADSIKISNIAYYSKIIFASDFKSVYTILLSENIQQLNGITIQNLSSYKMETSLGFYDYPDNGEFKLMPGNQIALYIHNKQEKEGWVKGVSFKIKESGKCKNSMRIRLLQPDTLRFLPSSDMLEENVLIKSIDLRKSNYIDLSAYKIVLPKEGIFIVLEWVYPDQDCDKNSYTSLSVT